MYWKQSYYLKYYFRSSLWVVPLIAIPFALVATRVLHRVDAYRRQEAFPGGSFGTS